jgi:hypothetical protein
MKRAGFQAVNCNVYLVRISRSILSERTQYIVRRVADRASGGWDGAHRLSSVLVIVGRGRRSDALPIGFWNAALLGCVGAVPRIAPLTQDKMEIRWCYLRFKKREEQQ